MLAGHLVRTFRPSRTLALQVISNSVNPYTGLGAQKMSPKNRAVLSTQKFIFYQTYNKLILFCELHRKLDFLNAYI